MSWHKMRHLSTRQKLILTIFENFSVFLIVFLNQMIITVFPAYESVKFNSTFRDCLNATSDVNCTMKDPSNSYVAILIGCKYCTELLVIPVVGLVSDHYHPPLILFAGLVTEMVACILYSATGNFYVTIVGRIIDGLGNSLVSTSGLTIIYMIYLRDRPRNRLVTIDNILAYISAYVSPFVAGYVFESLSIRGEDVARSVTFTMVAPFFLICSMMTAPFAFQNSFLFSRWFSRPCDKEDTTNSMFESTEVKEVSDAVVTKSPLSLFVLLKDRDIMLIMVMLTFNSLICNSLETTLPIFMIRKFCADQRKQGIVWVFGMMSLAGFFVSTFLFHMRPSVCWVLPLVGLLVNGVLCVTLPFSEPWWIIGLILGIMSFFSSMTDVILIPLVPKIIDANYPESSYGSGSGLTIITFTISGLLGSFPVGPLVDRFGFMTLCSVLCASNVCLAPSLLFLRPYFK